MNIRILCTLFFLLSHVTLAAELTPEGYVKAYSSGTEQEQSINESLAWAGLSDPEIFDPIEQQLLNAYLSKQSKDKIDYLSWLAKGLGFSGNPKYIPSLTTIAKDAKSKKLRRHAESALAILSKYQQWNPIIAPDAGIGLPYPTTSQRLKIMLDSNDMELIRVAAKRMYLSRMSDHELISTASKLIEKHYQSDGDKVFIDTVAWLCKAVANSKNPQYKPLIERVSTSANNKKLRNYARKYLNYYN